MKRTMKMMTAALLLITMVGTMMVGCGRKNAADFSENAGQKQSAEKGQPVDDKKLDLNEYVKFELEGTDGYGELKDMYLDI